MRLISVRPGALTSCDLGSGHWRLVITAVPGPAHPSLALVLRELPSVPVAFRGDAVVPLMPLNQLVLAAASIDLVTRVEDVQPVAERALDGADETTCRARFSEAFTLLRNLPQRVRDETFVACEKEGASLISGYWSIVSWLLSSERTRSQLNIADASVVLTP